MVIDEVFPNPLVKQAIFQIKFPNLFYIEDKIGDFQVKILDVFPDSALLYRRQILFADVGPEGEPLEQLGKESVGKKIWQFKSPKKFTLNVLTDSLDINSEHHKTYDLENGAKFRDIIKLVLDNFLEITKIPHISRIGLRYINEGPTVEKTDEQFRSYYSSTFPLDRFSLERANEMTFSAVVKKNGHNFRYRETLKTNDKDCKLILDLDSFAENIKSEDWLAVTDTLHGEIIDEFERSIKDPVYEYMRQRGEAGDYNG